MFSRVLTLLCAWLLCLQAAAADLVVAQVFPKTGPLAATGLGNYLGAKAYFDQVNAQGGINGRAIRFVFEDDQYKADETVRLLQVVAERDKPLVFVNLLGSAAITALLKDQTLDRTGIPVIGATPGSETLRTPGSPWLFHLQAGDRAQIERIMSHLATLGLTRIAVVYQDNPYGRSGLGFAEEFAAHLKVQVVAKAAVASAAEDLRSTVQQVRAAAPQAYLAILVPNSGASFVRDARAMSDKTPIYSLSYLTAQGIIEKAGLEHAAGIALAQVTPNAATGTTGLTREFRATMGKFAPDVTDLSSSHLIGYLAGRVAVEVLRRAGPDPTPLKIAAALRRLRVDFGGYSIDFLSGGNIASRYVDIGVVNRSGRLVY